MILSPQRLPPGFTLLELTVVLLILVALAGVVVPLTQGTVEQAACQATDATMMAVKEAIMGSGAGPGYYSDMGNYPASPSNPTEYTLHYLFMRGTHPQFKPTIAKGWRGPYLQNGGGKLADPGEFSAAHGTNYHDTNYVSFDHSNTVYQNDVFIFDHFRPWDRDDDHISSRNPIVLQVPSKTLDCPGHPGPQDGQWCARVVSAGPDGVLNTRIDDLTAANRGDDRVLFLRIPDPNPNGNLPCAGK